MSTDRKRYIKKLTESSWTQKGEVVKSRRILQMRQWVTYYRTFVQYYRSTAPHLHLHTHKHNIYLGTWPSKQLCSYIYLHEFFYSVLVEELGSTPKTRLTEKRYKVKQLLRLVFFCTQSKYYITIRLMCEPCPRQCNACLRENCFFM